MDRQQIGLKLALDGLAQDLVLSDFDRRLALQKTIYLTQAAGIDLGYTFTWYLRGPYSPGLTRDAFALHAELLQNPEEWRGWSLDAASVGRLARLRQLLSSLPEVGRAQRLELLASVHFLLKTRQADAADAAGLRAVLLRNNKNFSEEEIRQSIDELRAYELLPARA